jgi:hypothetical protein
MAPTLWAQTESLVAITVEFGNRDRSLLSLIDAWSAHVLKLYEELDLDLDDLTASTWNADDLVGAYILRDAVETGLNQLHGLTGEPREVASLRATDQLLVTFTFDDADGLLNRRMANVSERSGWWWRRLPQRGPVIQDLTQ